MYVGIVSVCTVCSIGNASNAATFVKSQVCDDNIVDSLSRGGLASRNSMWLRRTKKALVRNMYMRQSPVKHSTSIIGSATPPRNADDAASAPGKALPPILIEVWPGGMHAPIPHIRTDTAESSNRTLKESPLGTERAHQRPHSSRIRYPISGGYAASACSGSVILAPGCGIWAQGPSLNLGSVRPQHGSPGVRF